MSLEYYKMILYTYHKKLREYCKAAYENYDKALELELKDRQAFAPGDLEYLRGKAEAYEDALQLLEKMR